MGFYGFLGAKLVIEKKRESKGYRKFLKALRALDGGLYRFAVENLSSEAYEWLVAQLPIARPELHKRFQACLSAKPKRASHKKEVVEEAWKIAKELQATYSCLGGFHEKGVPRTATIHLNFEKRYVGFIPELLQLQDRLLRDVEGRRKWTFSFDNRVFTANLTDEQIEYLRRSKFVRKVEISPMVRALYGEYAPYPEFKPGEENVDWGVSKLNVSYAWNKGIKGKGVKVCVCDTGIDYTHVDLQDAYKGGWNFVSGNDDPMDDHMHGTHCSGIIGARDNGIGYTGVAPECELYHCKVLNSKGQGYADDIAAGIDWARLNGMHIISLSLGGDMACSGPMKDACDAAWAAGLVVVAAAGNSGEDCEDNDCVLCPANCESVIAVASVNLYGCISRFSSRGPEVEVAAPGEGITSCWLKGHDLYGDGKHIVGEAWYWANGTSMACPHVAGAAALIKCWYPDATNYEIRQWLREKAFDI